MGAAIATLISQSFLLILGAFVANKYYKIITPKIIPVISVFKYFIASIIMWAALSSITVKLNIFVMILIGALCYIVTLLIIDHDSRDLVKNVKNKLGF